MPKSFTILLSDTIKQSHKSRTERFPISISRPVLILHGLADKATKPSGSQKFYESAGSKDKTLKFYEGHYHDILNDLDKEVVMTDILNWIDERIPATNEELPVRENRI